MNNEEINEMLKNLLHYRMQVKYRVEEYRANQELSGISFEIEINELLEKIVELDKLEKKLSTLKKKR